MLFSKCKEIKDWPVTAVQSLSLDNGGLKTIDEEQEPPDEEIIKIMLHSSLNVKLLFHRKCFWEILLQGY